MSGLAQWLAQRAEEEGPRQPTLEVVGGPHDGRLWSLKGLPLAVGSTHRADLVQEGDPSLAPRHALLDQDEGGHFIEALEGAPMWHNGQPATGRVRLAAGDAIKLGDTNLLFHPGTQASRGGEG